MSTLQVPYCTRESHKRRKASAQHVASAEQVRDMLREIAFVLHATRVVAKTEPSVLAKKG